MNKCAGSVRSGTISLRVAPRNYSRVGNEQPRNRICALSGDADEELFTLSSVHRKRPCSSLIVSGRQVRFLLDCGATVNPLPVDLAREMDPQLTNFSRAESTLRMFDNISLKTEGMLTTRVEHPVNRQARTLDFYIATTHSQLILGLEACLLFYLLSVNEKNSCAVQSTSPTSAALTAEVDMQTCSSDVEHFRERFIWKRTPPSSLSRCPSVDLQFQSRTK